jgi:hypothetical protein
MTDNKRFAQLPGPRLFRSFRLVTRLLYFLLFTPTISFAADEEPSLEVAVSAEEIFVGESIDFQVEIQNVENPSAPDVAALRKQFDVVPNGNQSRNQSSTFVVNGRISQQNVFSHVYLYRLTPKVSGELTIPAVKAKVGETELVSRTISLRVQDLEIQDVVLLEIKTDPPTVYPTQPFTVTARMLIRPLPDGTTDPLRPLRRQPPNLQINWVDVFPGLTTNETSAWLQPLISPDGSGLTLNEISASTGSIFGNSRPAVFDLSKGRETRNGLDEKPVDYFVYELSRRYTAEKPGPYAFGPAMVKGRFVAGEQQAEFVGRRIVAVTPAVTVEVREVPSPRPASFIGGIGEYHVAASASPSKLRVGDPLTLTLEFARGNQAGSLELIAAPDLTLIPEIAQNFDILDKAPTGRVNGDIKTFAYAMRPKQPGVSLPALTLTTFDPSKEAFTELTTSAIPLEVSEATQLSGSELVGAVSAAAASDIQKNASGIFQNITDTAAFRDERIQLKYWLAAVAGVWCLNGIVIAGVSLQRRKSVNVAGTRKSQARRSALTRLNAAKQLQDQGQTKDALRQIRTAFAGLVADIHNRVADGLTTADIFRALQEAAVPEAIQVDTRRLLESIEGAEYGGSNAISADAAINSAITLMESIAPLLERSVGR